MPVTVPVLVGVEPPHPANVAAEIATANKEGSQTLNTRIARFMRPPGEQKDGQSSNVSDAPSRLPLKTPDCRWTQGLAWRHATGSPTIVRPPHRTEGPSVGSS